MSKQKNDGIKKESKKTYKKEKNSSKNNVSELKKIEDSLIKDYDESDENKSTLKKTKPIITEEKDNNKLSVIKNNRNILIGFVVGLAIGLVVMGLLVPERIATLENGQQVIVEMENDSITADELYKDMKDYYSVSVLLDKIDTKILNNLYPEDNDMKTSVQNTADYYISMYETSYGYSQDDFLKANGFSSYDDFINYLLLDYRRNLYYDEYVNDLITDDEINKYYSKSVFGDIASKYISIDASNDENGAEDIAKEIINKLNNGKSYDDILTEYKDKIKYDDLGYVSFDSSQDETYISTLKTLKDNSYTTTAPEIDNTYYIIFREDQKSKDSLDNLKERIIKKLNSDKKNSDSTLKFKALEKLRKDNNVEIKDTDLEKKYEKYLKENTQSK